MKERIFIKVAFLWVFFCMLILLLTLHGDEPHKESELNQISKNFSNSNFALFIGIDYCDNKNWPPLQNAIKDSVLVGNELKSRGFDVTYQINLNHNELGRVLEKFFFRTAVDYNSSLFIWFSGHGRNISGEGFLVPADAPKINDTKFKDNAFPIRRLAELSKLTKAKHIFMVFDSCVSSDILKEKVEDESQDISVAKKSQARQFLCLGRSGKTRPDDGEFRKWFIEALRNELKGMNKVIADTNKDYYLTANEFGRFVKLKIESSYYGRLSDYQNSNKGEFFFHLASIPGESFHDPLKLSITGYGPEMIVVPSGTFMMGSKKSNSYENEKTLYNVYVDSIAVSVFEITFNDYALFCTDAKRVLPDDNSWGRGNRPVINVSWEDAKAYTEWLSEQTGYKYRLPTEAEWEYFARAGTDTDYWWGDESGQNNAACDGCGAQWGYDTEQKTAPVGSFVSNPFGIFDTVGNVWEWTCSEYTDVYIGKEKKCLDKITNPWQQVILRGGSWVDRPAECRVSYRKNGYPASIFNNVGFRVVRELK